MTINARLDEMAKETFDEIDPLNWSEVEITKVRAALNKAIELVLTAEPSVGMVNAGYPPNSPEAQDWGVYEIYRAMSAALLEEIKK